MTTITRDMVRSALAALYVNRSKREGFAYVRSILQTCGNGVVSIGELDPEFYANVYAAAGGVFASHSDHGRELLPQREPWDVVDDPPASRARIRSPLVAELEARLAAARAKTKRSTPDYVVNIGNASRPEDQRDDVARAEPAGQKMS